MKGYVHVYTGDGKGKTTAALGLALRAAGAGHKVFIAQFIKAGDFSEIKSLRRFSDRITVMQFGQGRFRENPPPPLQIGLARRGLDKIKQVMTSGRYQVVILEEASVAVSKGLFPVEDLLDLIDAKPADMELVVTGRNADRRLIEKADLVTEMVKIKHYFQKGVKARVGIEK